MNLDDNRFLGEGFSVPTEKQGQMRSFQKLLVHQGVEMNSDQQLKCLAESWYNVRGAVAVWKLNIVRVCIFGEHCREEMQIEKFLQCINFFFHSLVPSSNDSVPFLPLFPPSVLLLIKLNVQWCIWTVHPMRSLSLCVCLRLSHPQTHTARYLTQVIIIQDAL